MAKRMLSRTEVIAAHGLFKENLIPSSKEGFFNYKADWSDAKVAATLDPTIQISSIARLRVELFGQLDTMANTSREDNIRIKELETLVQNLLTCYGEMEVKYNKLVDTIALNRVLPTNILHLKTTKQEEKKNG